MRDHVPPPGADEPPQEPEGSGEPSGELGPEDVRRLAELAERETAYGLFQRGQAFLRQRHYAQAAVVLERAALQEPGRGSIVEALARAYYNSGQTERAREAFQDLLEIDPTNAYGHYGLGQACRRLGRLDEARTHLRLAVAMAPESSLYRGALERLGGGVG